MSDMPSKPHRWRSAGFCLICVALSTLCAALLLAIILVVLHIPLAIEPLSLGRLLVFAYREAIVPVIAFAAEIVKSLFPWPIVALVVIALLVWGPDRFTKILSSINVEFPGWIKLGGLSAPEQFQKELSEAERVVERANKEIKEAYESARLYASQLRERYDIAKWVSALATDVAAAIGERCPDDYRLTLYVSDFVFGDRLYHFTEYYNKQGERLSENKAGRTFSIRYGIIGRVWRSGVPEIEGELISADDREHMRRRSENPDNAYELERFIARRWGLTLEEAVHVRQYNSYGAIRVNRADHPVGVVYFDSKIRKAFGDTDKLLAQVENLVSSSPLAEKLLEISREVTPWSGRIQIFRNS